MYFEWSDGTPVTYTKWLQGEPTHATNQQEDCVAMKGKVKLFICLLLSEYCQIPVCFIERDSVDRTSVALTINYLLKACMYCFFKLEIAVSQWKTLWAYVQENSRSLKRVKADNFSFDTVTQWAGELYQEAELGIKFCS